MSTNESLEGRFASLCLGPTLLLLGGCDNSNNGGDGDPSTEKSESFESESSYPQGPYGNEAGNTIENLEFQDLEGNPVSLDQIRSDRAKGLAIYATALWCFTCQAEIEWFNEHPAVKDGSLAVATVVLEGSDFGRADSEDGRQLQEAFDPVYPVLLDDNDVLHPFRQGKQIPINLIIRLSDMSLELVREGFESSAIQKAIDSVLE